MIYLVTGTPGLGKTSAMLKWVLDNKFGLFKNEDGGYRPIFSVGIEYTKPKQLPIIEVEPDDFKAKPLHENFPQGSVIIVDEASEIYPKRAAAKQMPVHVEGLNRLRHYGLTLFVLTQRPSMIDSFVCDLVGKHIHLERKQLGSKLYEWNHFQSSMNQTAFKDAYSEFYSPDKRVFDMYVSSTKHIKFKKSLSWYWYALPVLPFVVLGMYWLALSILEGMAGDVPKPQAVVAQPPPAASAPAVQLPLRSEQDFRQPERSANLAASDFVPTVEGHDESAPIYNEVRKVVDFPQVIGCMQSGKRCKCYSQQGTEIETISTAACRERIRRRPFNPYLSPEREMAAVKE